MQGAIGRFFFQFGISCTVAVLLSLVISLTITPMLCSFFLRVHHAGGPKPAAFIGAVLVSLGFFLTSLTSSLAFLYVVFGVIVGAGNGFGYATPIPVASTASHVKIKRWRVDHALGVGGRGQRHDEQREGQSVRHDGASPGTRARCGWV